MGVELSEPESVIKWASFGCDANDLYFSLLLQEAERWRRSVLKVAQIAGALISERSAALVGQVMQA